MSAWLEIPGVNGDGTDTKKNWIKLKSFGFGISSSYNMNKSTNTDQIVGDPHVSCITFAKEMDSSSQGLLQLALNREAKKMTIHYEPDSSGDNKGNEVKLILENAKVVWYDHKVSGHQSMPEEQFSVVFTKVEAKFSNRKTGDAANPSSVNYDITKAKLS